MKALRSYQPGRVLNTSINIRRWPVQQTNNTGEDLSELHYELFQVGVWEGQKKSLT